MKLLTDAEFIIRHHHVTEAQLLEGFSQMKPIELVELRDAFEKAKPIILELARKVKSTCQQRGLREPQKDTCHSVKLLRKNDTIESAVGIRPSVNCLRAIEGVGHIHQRRPTYQ